jgi:hypothetical protein
MSTSQIATVTAVPAEVAEARPEEQVFNSNPGPGTQHNATQMGGHDNSQYNANT